VFKEYRGSKGQPVFRAQVGRRDRRGYRVDLQDGQEIQDLQDGQDGQDLRAWLERQRPRVPPATRDPREIQAHRVFRELLRTLEQPDLRVSRDPRVTLGLRGIRVLQDFRA